MCLSPKMKASQEAPTPSPGAKALELVWTVDWVSGQTISRDQGGVGAFSHGSWYSAIVVPSRPDLHPPRSPSLSLLSPLAHLAE